MKKEDGKNSRTIALVIAIAALVIFFFVIVPLMFVQKDGAKIGNVGIITIQGPITTDGSGALGEQSVSSKSIIKLIQEAEENPHIKVMVLEINSPGGSAVASDEIASTVKMAEKPVIAQIREVGASGGYWIASATDHIIAHKMSITGSIGVISSYLEFSGLLEKYNVTYQRLTAGKYKDIGTPYKLLEREERSILQEKLNTIHRYFIQEVAENRGLPEKTVEKLATGEFFLGVEALDYGLVDELGDFSTVVEYIKTEYGLTEVQPVFFEEKFTLLELLTSVFADFSFNIGKGIASLMLQSPKGVLLS